MTRIPAIYHDGVFIPEIAVAIANESAVEVLIEDSCLIGSVSLTDADRAKLRKAAVETMKQRRLTPDAPRFSRDELHDRR